MSEFFSIEYDDARDLVRVIRTPRPFNALAGLHSGFADLHRFIDANAGENTSLLIDLRRSPARNDQAFEAAIAPERVRLLNRFKRSAFVVATAVGRLQVTRHVRESGLNATVWVEVEQALSALEVSALPPRV